MDKTEKSNIFQVLPIWKRLFLLYFSFFRITALVVGGGLAMLPVIEEIFVNRYKCITKEELLDMVTLTQTMPGIIAMNSAVYIGMKIAGIPGALAAVFGAFTPPFVVILLIAALFPHLDPHNRYLSGAFTGVRACVTGLIIMSACKLIRSAVKCIFEACVVIVIFVLVICGVSPIYLILASMPLGWIYLWLTRQRLKRAEIQKANSTEDDGHD